MVSGKNQVPDNMDNEVTLCEGNTVMTMKAHTGP
jgi:hypothetical protein